MTRMRRVALTGVVLVFSVTPVAHAQGDPIDALLDARAASVLAHDEPAFRATMTGAHSTFVGQRLLWFAGMRDLPIETYRLERDLDGPSSYPARPRDGFDETTVITVLETLGLEGFDGDAPQVLERHYTFARRSGTWSIVDDTELADVGLRSAKDLWDLGPVTTEVDRGVLVIGRNVSAARATTFIREIDTARKRADQRWPFGAPPTVVALIPGTSADLRELFAAQYDIERFVGFASSTWARREGEVVIGGRRLLVNPSGYFDASSSGRADIMNHELLHLAASPYTGAWVPAWLEEGVAQVYGERSPRSTAGLRRTHVSLPEDYIFAAGTDVEVSRAYRTSLSVVRFMVARHGRAAVARFYRELGSYSAVIAGTPAYHLDRASRRIFRVPFAPMVRAWQQDVRKG